MHFDGAIAQKLDTLARTVGDFSIKIDNEELYGEVEFCLLEFAAALATWASIVTDLGPHFVYTSMESETEGLVRFTRLLPGRWRVHSADIDATEGRSVSTQQLVAAVLTYLRELRASLIHTFDVLDYIDLDARGVLESKLR